MLRFMNYRALDLAQSVTACSDLRSLLGAILCECNSILRFLEEKQQNRSFNRLIISVDLNWLMWQIHCFVLTKCCNSMPRFFHIAKIRNKGIAVMAGFIAGFDSDTEESILQMSSKIKEINIDVPFLSIMTLSKEQLFTMT